MIETGNTQWVTREELYEMVWSNPMSKLAKEFGISDVGLAKKCDKLDIPRPGRGYWARVKYGWKGKKPKLPVRLKEQPDSIRIERSGTEEVVAMELSQNVLDEIASLKSRENRVSPHDDFEGAHPLVRRTRKLFKAATEDEYGRLWNIRDTPCLNLHVGRKVLDRTLLIFDAILDTIEKHNFKVEVFNSESKWGTYLSRGGVDMHLSAFEKAKRFTHTPTEKEKNDRWSYYHKYDYAPSGEIEIILTRWPLNERRWKDLKSATLEDQLTNIVVAIIESSERVKGELAKREEDRKRQIEDRRLAEERRLLAAEQEKRRQELVQQATDWNTAKRIREYLTACAIQLDNSEGDQEQREQLVEWIRWGCENADCIDPLKNGAQPRLMSKTLIQKS